MPDIGFGEILVIVVLALLVFGPDKLPKVASDAARTLRNLRQMASAARRDLVDASGISDDDEIAQTVRDLRELDPRNVMKEPPPQRPSAGRDRGSRPTQRPSSPAASGEGAQPPGAAPAPDGPLPGNGAGGAQPGAQPDATATNSSGEPRPDSAGSAPKATPGAAAADPDWT